MKTTEYNSKASVISNEVLAGMVPAKTSFGMTITKISKDLF